MKKFYKTNKLGFTLVELMCVIAILIILTGIGFINWRDGIARGEDVQSRDSAKFVTQVQSANDNIRHNMLSGTPRYSGT